MVGDLAFDKETGKFADPQQKLQEILAEIKLADELGIDVFALGEHHRPDYVVSSPEMVLSAAASITTSTTERNFKRRECTTTELECTCRILEGGVL